MTATICHQLVLYSLTKTKVYLNYKYKKVMQQYILFLNVL